MEYLKAKLEGSMNSRNLTVLDLDLTKLLEI